MSNARLIQLRHAAAHGRRAPKGIALVMVLSVVAATSILAWAMLSASAMRSQIDSNAVDAAEATSLSESGASYAMHALHYPALFRPSGADAATWFYPGEFGLKLWSDARGTVDIAVTSTGADTRKIRATATVLRPGATTGTKHVVEANVTNIYQGINNAMALNSGVAITSNVHIVGPVVASGTVTGQGNVSGSPTITPTGSNTVPTASEVRLFSETNVVASGSGTISTDRTYTWNGNTYVAEKMASGSIGSSGLATARPALNPCNVWYSDSNVTMTNASFTGVLVLRGTSSLNVAGTCSITAPSGMPALVVGKRIDLKSTLITPAKLTINGAAWIGEKLYASSYDNPSAVININGALLWADPSAAFQLSGTVNITYKASSVAAITNISTIKTIDSLKINSWQSTD